MATFTVFHHGAPQVFNDAPSAMAAARGMVFLSDPFRTGPYRAALYLKELTTGAGYVSWDYGFSSVEIRRND